MNCDGNRHLVELVEAAEGHATTQMVHAELFIPAVKFICVAYGAFACTWRKVGTLLAAVNYV